MPHQIEARVDDRLFAFVHLDHVVFVGQQPHVGMIYSPRHFSALGYALDYVALLDAQRFYCDNRAARPRKLARHPQILGNLIESLIHGESDVAVRVSGYVARRAAAIPRPAVQFRPRAQKLPSKTRAQE